MVIILSNNSQNDNLQHTTTTDATLSYVLTQSSILRSNASYQNLSCHNTWHVVLRVVIVCGSMPRILQYCGTPYVHRRTITLMYTASDSLTFDGRVDCYIIPDYNMLRDAVKTHSTVSLLRRGVE